jgi:hypothetical protein
VISVLCLANEVQRSMRVIFEPSRLKLYIRPFLSNTKPIMGLVRLSVSIDPPAPSVTITIDPSMPTFRRMPFEIIESFARCVVPLDSYLGSNFHGHVRALR